MSTSTVFRRRVHNGYRWITYAGAALVLALPSFLGAGTISVSQPAGDDINTSTIFSASYQTYCNWILQGLTTLGYTPANGYNFAFAGSTLAPDVPNIPASDLKVVNYFPWVVTDPGLTDLGGTERRRPVTDQEAGGARFELKYTPRAGSNDPTSVNWLQAYLQNINGAGFSSGILDNGGAKQKDGGSPYYNAQGVAGTLPNNVAWMEDGPYTCESGGASNADCSGGTDDAWTSEAVKFQTFVVGANPVDIGGTNYLILYGGEQWGYTYSSVDIPTPEPALGILGGILALAFAVTKLYLSRHPKSPYCSGMLRSK